MKINILVYLTLALTSCERFTIDDNLPLNEKADKYFTYLTEKKGFHGVVLVYKEGTVVINKGFGSASDEKNLSMKSETILDIGSITKPFTSTAIIRLVEQNILNTDQKLNNFFQNVPVDKKDISIHQLLTHTSGLLPDFAGDLDVLDQ